MIGKLLLAATLALAPAPVAPSQYETRVDGNYSNIPAVKQVWCTGTAGTAVVAEGRLISVAHVTDGAGCRVDGQLIHAVQDKGLDFSVIDNIAVGLGFKINCEGFKEGEYYHAVGYANGLPFQRVLTLMGTGQNAGNGMAILWGWPNLIPGMSGGVMLNSRAEAVGMNNMYTPFHPISLSVALKDTSLCHA